MKKNPFEDLMIKINFKKVLIVYLIAAIIAGTVSVITLAVVFKDKIALMRDYNSISENYENNRKNSITYTELSDFAIKSPDVMDVLVLDKDNNMIYSAKGSDISKGGKLNLQAVLNTSSLIGTEHNDNESHDGNAFFMDPAVPDVYYRTIKNELSALKMLVKGSSASEKFEENHFFESGNKKVYSLSYTFNRQTGEKIYFIFDIVPIQNATLYLKMIAAAAMLFFMLYWVLLAFYVYADATRSKLKGAAWGILTLFTNLGGLIIYVIFKQNHQTCFKCHAVQSKDNAYCTFCGAKLSEFCHECNGVIDRDNTYCKHCGIKKE